MSENQSSQKQYSLDLNLSQVAPINKMMKKATVIKQLIDAIPKQKVETKNDKNWFKIENKGK